MTVLSSDGAIVRGAAPARNWLASPLFFWTILALYLAAHIALRLWMSPNLGKNDVQEALAAHSWAWGYHPRNPPLHTWLLMASYSVFGVGLMAHVILKYVLLGLAYAFAYLSGRRVLSTPALATVAAFSLTALTPFAWTVHTAFTHTLLLAVVILATLWAAMRLTATRHWSDYALLGLIIGLGFLAKYSYPLFLLPLTAAMLCQAEFRRAIFNVKSLLTLGVALLVFAPHGAWMMSARFDFARFLADKQQSEAPHPYLLDVASGLGAVAAGALTFLAPLLLLAAVFFRKWRRSKVSEASNWGSVLLLIPVFGLGLLLLDVFVLRATQFEERYFMCALLVAPIALFAWVDRREAGLGGGALAKFSVATLAISLIAFAALDAKALAYNETCRRCWDEMAAPQLVHAIRTESGFQNGTLITDHYNVGGNLSVAFPNARVVAVNYLIDTPRQDESGQCLLVWNARNAGDALPPSIANYLAERHVAPPTGHPTYVDAPLLRSTHRMDRFAYWLLPNANGNCDPRAPVSGGAISSF